MSHTNWRCAKCGWPCLPGDIYCSKHDDSGQALLVMTALLALLALAARACS